MSLHPDDELELDSFSKYGNALMTTNEIQTIIEEGLVSEESMQLAGQKYSELDDYERECAYFYLLGQVYELKKDMSDLFDYDPEADTD